MPDERCEWLDKDMADRLLNGGPVGAVDDHARAQAARLYAALDGVARPATDPESGEFPGEKLALEAFRQARETTPNALGPVHVGAASAPVSPAGTRWRRPVWLGFVVAAAGCTLSGVAVAAGAGMLPSPFRPHEPVPASSVSAAATVSPPSSPTTGAGTSPVPVPGPGQSDRQGDQDRSDDQLPGGRQGGQRQDPGRGHGGGTETPPGTSDRDRTSHGGAGHGAGKVHLRLVTACRDYRAGHVDGAGRHALETHAHGASEIMKFCNRVLDDKNGANGNGKKDKGDESGGGSGDGGSDPGDASIVPDVSPSTPSSSTTPSLASALIHASTSSAAPSAAASAGHGRGASTGGHGQTDR